ncbi:thiamine-phosphate kinase [Virgibacillus siamensis]|uniref:thiamine-phosphate kinase n=1 Tax=Virgibacillus siamensis TaxID=480071 RepID=UPI000986D7A7|nr:thiamine-phosphate kinase [Virgibacillus siamensis]
MDEFSFINSIKQHMYRQSSIVKGIGDDAAVFRQTSQDIITAVDTFVEDVHFARATMSPFHVGFRSVAANVSDLAAMGATPAFYLVSMVIPKSWSQDELEGIYDGMKTMAARHHMDLIGGDTVSGPALSISVTVIGYTTTNKARYRSTASENDIVFVTGTLGDSRAGFHMLTNPGTYKNEAYFYNRHRMPLPRVDFASRLSSLKRVALNDISDGIANEAAEIAEASNVDIVLYEEKIPTSDPFRQFSREQQYEWKLFGGEDFELAGTVSPTEWDRMIEIAKKTETPLARVGFVERSKSQANNVFIIDSNKQKHRLDKKGYTHLADEKE